MLQSRPYQERIVRNAVDMFTGNYRRLDGSFELPIKSVMVESACGSGKTAMGHLIAKRMRSEYSDLTIAWVAHRRVLLDQAASENRRLGINCDRIHYVSMFNSYPDDLVEARRNGRMMIVTDEAQHDAAGSMTHLHNLLKPDFVLGLSATPYRVDNVKLCFEKVLRDAGIHQLIQDGYLSKYRMFTMDEWSPANVAETYLREPERWGKSAFYFLTLEECMELHYLLAKAGYDSEVVTGTSDCDEQINRFETGDCPRIINCLKLTEGFNCPDMQTVFVRDGSRGPTIQMAGRVLRTHPDIPVKQIVQSQQTKWPFSRTARPVEHLTWKNEQWLGVGSSGKADLIALDTIRQLSTIDVKLPQFITRSKSGGKVRVIGGEPKKTKKKSK